MISTTFKEIVDFIRSLYPGKEIIPLHEPVFMGNEKKFVNECIDSTFVSSVGPFVEKFENAVADYTGSKYAVATSSGTAALHIALLLSGVKPNDEVITQPITFIATANAITYCGADPVFVDIDMDTLGLSPDSLQEFLESSTVIDKKGNVVNKTTKKTIRACIPMHTFGHPVKIDKIKKICDDHNIILVEDAAEAIGSYYNNQHTGTFGKFGILSFNGNKTITTGGGGMILTNEKELAERAKHLTTQAKIPHPWEYIHNEIGYNYRLPNINAALGCAQMEVLESLIEKKRFLATKYFEFCKHININFIIEPSHSRSNYWLNGIVFENCHERDAFLKYSNENEIRTRPLWLLMNKQNMFKHCSTGILNISEWLQDRLVNVPSSII